MALRKKTASEAQIQAAFFEHLSLLHPAIRRVSFHIPNGGKRSITEGAMLKRCGVVSGVPDVFIAVPAHGLHGLFIEFKAGKNTATDNQKEMMRLFTKQGYYCQICYSEESALDALNDYLRGKLCQDSTIINSAPPSSNQL